MLSYEQTGFTNNPCLVFLHGFLGCKEDWRGIISQLEGSYHCLSFDLPAHGKSAFTLEIDDSIVSSIQELSVQRPVLIGYSMGGRIALSLCDKHPKFFSGLVALSAHTGLKNNKQKELRVRSEQEWIHLLLHSSSENFLQKWYEQSVFSSLMHKPHLYDALIQKRRVSNPEELALILQSSSLAKQKVFRKFFIPSYFLCGEEDGKYAELYSTLPKTIKMDAISNCGHVLHLENPSICAEKIKQWLIEENPWIK